jgi:hypothetical protein
MPGSIIPLSAEPLGVWLAVAAFFAGGIANATGRPGIRASFTRLGFPGWWCRVTAALEIATALLLLMPSSRILGIVLGGCIMVAAIAAILGRRLYGHLPPPVIFLFLLTLAGLGQPA